MLLQARAALLRAERPQALDEELRTARARGLLREDFDVEEVAATFLAVMDGLQLRYLLTPGEMRIDVAFAVLAGQVLQDLVADDPRAAATVSAWRARHAGPSSA